MLRHAAASLDSLVATPAATLDFGTQDSASFVPLEVRVHNLGWDLLQAQLALATGVIAGGDGHFSLVGGFSPVLLSGLGRSFDVLFDPAGATPDSAYEATLTFGSADEPLPGATAQADLVVTLRAQKTGGGTTGVEAGPPAATLLYAPYPNPLRGSSTLRFDVAHEGDVAVEIFDVTGRRTATLLHDALAPGRYSVAWAGRAEDGSIAHAGLYFVRMTTAGARHTARLVVVK